MSRTFKDKPSRCKAEPWDIDWIWVEGYGHRDAPTKKTKKRKEVDTEDHWMTTPSWWNNLFHTRPIRGKFRKFAANVVKVRIDSIEDMLEPTDSHKPHKYFW